MDIQTNSLFDQAMKLSPLQREDLAARLYDSLHTDEAKLDPSWDAEIARRIEEIDSGKVKLIPAEEVFREMRERAGG